jgi:hypothetical protein
MFSEEHVAEEFALAKKKQTDRSPSCLWSYKVGNRVDVCAEAFEGQWIEPLGNAKWLGPFEVIEEREERHYRLRFPDGYNGPTVSHADNLKIKRRITYSVQPSYS